MTRDVNFERLFGERLDSHARKGCVIALHRCEKAKGNARSVIALRTSAVIDAGDCCTRKLCVLLWMHDATHALPKFFATKHTHRTQQSAVHQLDERNHEIPPPLQRSAHVSPNLQLETAVRLRCWCCPHENRTMESNKIPTVQSNIISLLDDEPELPLSSVQYFTPGPMRTGAVPCNTLSSGRDVETTSRKPTANVHTKPRAKTTPTKAKRAKNSKMASMVNRTVGAVWRRMVGTAAPSSNNNKQQSLPSSLSSSSLPSSSSSSQPTRSPEEQNMVEIPEAEQISVQDNDVVVSVKFMHESVVGNRRMVACARRYFQAFKSASSVDQWVVFAEAVMRDVESRGGRFLARHDNGPWTLADKESARSRVMAMFRSISKKRTPQQGKVVWKFAKTNRTKIFKTTNAMTGMSLATSPSTPLWRKLPNVRYEGQAAARTNNAREGTSTNTNSYDQQQQVVGLEDNLAPPPMKQREPTPAQKVREQYPWLMPLIDCAAMEKDFPEYKTQDDDDDLDWTNI